MTNEDVIKTLMQLEYPYPFCEEQEKVNEALSLAIRAVSIDLDERDADAFESGYIVGLSETKKGKWIKKNKRVERDYFYFCSNCQYGISKAFIFFKFCPNCGADMREADNG